MNIKNEIEELREQNLILRKGLELIGDYAKEKSICSVYLENIAEKVEEILEEINERINI